MASEAMLNIVGDTLEAGYKPRAVVFDAQFSTRLALRSLRFMGIPFVSRCRTDLWAVHRKQRKVKELARQFHPAERGTIGVSASTRSESGWSWRRSAALARFWAGRARARAGSAWLWLLVSVRGCRGCWRSGGCGGSWNRASGCINRLLGWWRCLCRRFAAHLKRADLVLEAFHEVRLERLRSPSLTWRRAQEVVAARRRNAVLTGTNALVA